MFHELPTCTLHIPSLPPHLIKPAYERIACVYPFSNDGFSPAVDHKRIGSRLAFALLMRLGSIDYVVVV